MNISNTNQTVTSTDATQPSEGISAAGNPFAEYENPADEQPQGKKVSVTLAIKAINHYGSEQKWDRLKAWAGHLQSAAQAHPNDVVSHRDSMRRSPASMALAKAMYYVLAAMKHHGFDQKWTELEALGVCLQTMVQVHPNNEYFQMALSEGAVIAMRYYACARKWTQMEVWCGCLQTMVQAHPNNEHFQTVLTKGVVMAMCYCGFARRWDKFEELGTRLQLRTVSEGVVGAGENFRHLHSLYHLEWWCDGLQAASSNHECFMKGVLMVMYYYCCAKKWDELETWGNRLQSMLHAHLDNNKNPTFASSPWPTLSHNAKLLSCSADGAIEMMYCYGSEEKWEELEAWGNRLQSLIQAHLDDKETKKALARGYTYALSDKAMLHLWLAKGAVMAMECYSYAHRRANGFAQKWNELEAWGVCLQVVAQAHPCDEKILEVLAEGALCAMKIYGRAGMWSELGEWGARLQAVAQTHSNSTKIQEALARGSRSAILHYGYAQRWDELKVWVGHLQSTTHVLPNDDVFKRVYVRNDEMDCVFKAMEYYGSVQKWAELEALGVCLQTMAQARPQDECFQTALSGGAVIAMEHYGRAQKWEELEAWGGRLQAMVQTRPKDECFQTALSKGVVIAMDYCGRAQRWDKLEEWGGRAQFAAVAEGAVIATEHYGRAQKWEELKVWAGRLQAASSNYRCFKEGVFKVMDYCGSAQKWEEMETWGNRLQSVLRTHLDYNKSTKLANRSWTTLSHNAQLLSWSADGAIKAMGYYGRAQKWEELEAWGARLQNAVQAYLDNEETKKALKRGYTYALSDKAMLHLRLAEGAVIAMEHYSSAQKWDELEVWGNRLQAVVQTHPYDEEIQQCLQQSRRFTCNASALDTTLQAYLC